MRNVCMIGAGAIAAEHLAALDACGEARLLAVADLDAQRAGAAAAKRGARVYTDYREMLRREAPDAVIVNLPHALHEACVLACAGAGADILLEKPMSTTYASCLRMIDACQRAGVLLQVGHIQRYMPHNRAARALIESGALGALAMVCDLRTNPYFTPERPRWFLRKETAGGGISMNYAAHSLDKLCYLTDSALASVQGACTYLAPGADVDGSAQMLVRMESGVSACVSLCGYRAPQVNETLLYFSDGVLRLRTGVSLEISRGGAFEAVDASAWPDAFAAQWQDFLAAVRSRRVVHGTGDYAAAIVRAIEGLYR